MHGPMNVKLPSLFQIIVLKKKNFFLQVTLNVIQSNCYLSSAIIVTSLLGGGEGQGFGIIFLDGTKIILSGWRRGPRERFLPVG